MKKEDGAQPHSGHRERLRERYQKEGLDAFEDHNVLELLLFYTLPRVDTNLIAHRLLDRFGSLSAVFDADFEELAAVPGVGEKSALLIKMVPSLSRVYRMDKFRPARKTLTIPEIGAYFTEFFANKSTESMAVMMLDNSRRMICCKELFTGTVDTINLDSRRILDAVIAQKAASVVVAHNHPRGLLEPSGADLKTTVALDELFRTANIKMLDHLLIVGESWLSITNYRELNFTRYEPVYYIEPQKVTILPTKGKPKKK